jgi:hypothetical protein
MGGVTTHKKTSLLSPGAAAAKCGWVEASAVPLPHVALKVLQRARVRATPAPRRTKVWCQDVAQ